MEHIKKINNIADLAGFLVGKKVFLRTDFNVPIQNGHIVDAYRIESSLPTLQFLQKEQAVTILASHIETKDVDKPTLRPVFEYIQEKHPELHVVFCEDFLNTEALQAAVLACPKGGFILLENIRNAAESGFSEKDNSVSLAMYLKEFADIYVNDAFAVSHRTHASVDALPRLFDKTKKFAGFLLNKEIEALSQGTSPEHPVVAVLSGMKFSTKLPLIQKYIQSADALCIAGALFNNVLKSMGYEVGASLIDTEANGIGELVKTAGFKQKVYIPSHVVVKDTISNVVRTTAISEVTQTEFIEDIAPESIHAFMTDLTHMQAKTIIWNGPVGNSDIPEFAKGTILFAELLSEYVGHNQNVHALIGGGDTVAVLDSVVGLKNNEHIFISTGGGAMLEFLEKDGLLPGVVSLL